MKKFEQLHVEDQCQLALETVRIMFAGERRTIEDLARANGQTTLELWRDVCTEVGFDECEPWEGFPAWPKRENWNHVGDDDREVPHQTEKPLKQMRARL